MAFALAAVLAVAGTVALTTQAAYADPPLSVEEAKTQVAELETEAAAIDQEYVGVEQSLAQAGAKLKLKQADVRAQESKVQRLRLQVSQVALAQFQNRHLDAAAKVLLSEDTEELLSQLSTIEKVSENQNAVLQDLQEEQAKLVELEHSTETETARLQQEQAELAKLRTASDGKIAEAQAVLARLTAEERQLIATEEQKARDEAQAAAEGTVGGAAGVPLGSASAGSGRGAQALAFARTQLGKPYRYASAGPNAYDCSGLTYAAWRTVGVSLPRTSQTQLGVGRAVSRAELQLGDLVFFYSDISHVGLYAGNGQIIHSPRPGRSVEYAAIDSMPFAGARRPG